MKVRLFWFYFLCFVLAWAGVGSAQEENDTVSTDPNTVESPQDPPLPNGSDPNCTDPEWLEESDPFLDPQTDSDLSESVIPAFMKTSDALFDAFVTDENLVRYGDLRRYRRKLYHVYRYLDRVHPAHLMALQPNEKIAFWTNAYNICVLKLIVDNYPIQPKLFKIVFYPDNSVMQISNAWTKQYFDIMGLEYTLNEIQHEMLLERFPDPRLCFALSYASLGGGRLRQDAYRAETLDEQLNTQTRRYLESDYGYRLDKQEKVIHLSNLFSMYRPVFLKSEYASVKRFRNYPKHEQAWLNFLVSFLPPEDVTFIENNPCTFRMIRFNWALDEAK